MNHKPYRTRKEREKEKADALANDHGAEYSRIMLYCLKFIEDKDLDGDEVKAQVTSSETRWVDYAVRNKMTKTQREMFRVEIEKIITECKAEINRKLMRKSD